MTAAAVANPAASVLAADLARVISDTVIFASRDTTLPMINAVRLESSPKHLVAVATDRFTLASAVADYDEGSGPSFATALALPHAQLVAKVAKSTKAAFTYVSISESAVALTFTFASGEELSVPKLASAVEFPDWRKIIESCTADDEGGTHKFAVNPQLLSRFGRVTDSQRMDIQFGGRNKPAVVSVGSQFFGLIMPLRLDPAEETTAAPSWIARPEPPKKPRARRKSTKEVVA